MLAVAAAAGAPSACTCTIAVSTPSGPVSNTGAINCISVTNTTVSGNVTNASTGTITAGNGSTNNGILIENSGTVTGAVINNGKITSPSGQGIDIDPTSSVLGGVALLASITADDGILVFCTTTFGGG